MKKYWIFSLIFAAAALYAGCGEEGVVEPQPSKPSPVTKISEDTYVIEESDSLSLAQIQNSLFTFNYQGTPPDIEVGDIIVGKGEGGYLRRVSAVNYAAGQINLETTPASLVEAVESGQFSTSYQLFDRTGDPAAENGSGSVSGSVLHQAEGVELTDGGMNLSGVELYSGTVNSVDLEVTVASGFLDFQPVMSIGGVIKSSALSEFQAIAAGTFFYHCVLEATASGPVEHQGEVPLVSYQHTAYQQIGPVPVVEVMTINFFAGFDLDAAAAQTLRAGYQSEYTLEFGARYRNKAWEPVWEKGGEFVTVPAYWIQPVDATLQGYIRAEIVVEIYSTSGPSLQNQPRFVFSGALEDPQDWSWDLRAGVRGALEFDLSILDNTLGDWAYNLADWDSLVWYRSIGEPPAALITSPSEGERFLEGEQIFFSGQGNDPEDGMLPGDSLKWWSDRNGYLGRGDSFYRNDLSFGSHTITLAATDSDRNTRYDEISIHVNPNNPPTATVTGPAMKTYFLQGDPVTFEGSGEDSEDGQLSGESLRWSSSRDGVMGTGSPLTFSNLSANTHLITLTAIDLDGNTDIDSLIIHVIPVPEPWHHAMVTVPATTNFPMGRNDGSRDQWPVHTVHLDEFMMGVFEVTWALWVDVKRWGMTQGYVFANEGKRGSNSKFSNERHPVMMINWHDCLAWCNAYSEKNGYTPVYYYAGRAHTPDNVYRDSQSGGEIGNADVEWNADGYRLPTEAEWEYAARYIDGLSYSPADEHSGYNRDPDVVDCAWFEFNSDSTTHEVGLKFANSLGLEDMSGNVWEWCWDVFDYYDLLISPQVNPLGPPVGDHRVLRGGAWFLFRYHCATALRYELPSIDWFHSSGFRFCRRPAPPDTD
ncbi:MAG: SUMF1/EgtB/PvdO family nonheme iron enzyme [Candidatus Krumholzibacteriota bacterium]|nr:SUMF1/EgtB/PvdO family nonheme iron enzyme [Candidatus Krumholzibacteriota bacterium]